MKTSTFSYLLLKAFAALALAMPLIALVVVAGAQVGFIPVEGEAELTPALALFTIFSSIPFAYLGWIGWHGVSIVRAYPNGLLVSRGKTNEEIPWAQVLRISEVPCFTPPLYKFTFRSGQPAAYCMCFSLLVVTILWKSWDFTGFRPYCEKMIEDAGRASSQGHAA